MFMVASISASITLCGDRDSRRFSQELGFLAAAAFKLRRASGRELVEIKIRLNAVLLFGTMCLASTEFVFLFLAVVRNLATRRRSRSGADGDAGGVAV